MAKELAVLHKFVVGLGVTVLYCPYTVKGGRGIVFSNEVRCLLPAAII